MSEQVTNFECALNSCMHANIFELNEFTFLLVLLVRF